MKRGNISRVSFSDLPNDIQTNILLRLPIHGVLRCKSVCKAWRDLISEPQFAKLHFDKNPNRVCPLSHASSSIPDLDWLLGSTILPVMPSGFNVSPPYGIFDKSRYCIGNSCNGLLCLFHRSENHPAIICNPATSECIELPDDKKVDSCMSIRYALGYSHVSNAYKVVRMVFVGWTSTREAIITAQVHAVGSGSWRDLRSRPERFMYGSPVYLNGILYWMSRYSDPLSLTTFDIENECFGSESGPETEPADALPSVGVLQGDLCVSLRTIDAGGPIDVWTRKDCGTQKVWFKVFSIARSIEPILMVWKTSFLLNRTDIDGPLLVFFARSISFVHIDGEKCTFRILKISRTERQVEAIFPHVTSLVSLKHSLPGKNVKVIDLHSRFGELKLHDPITDLCLVKVDSSLGHLNATKH